MLAYLSWHRPAAGVEQAVYEQALARFHRSLAHRPPSGFRGSLALRLAELAWLAPAPGVGPGGQGAAGYEDWYLLDDWAAVGVLEEAAVSRGHETAHHAIAARAGAATGSVYRLLAGSPRPSATDVAVWVAHEPGHDRDSPAALLGDGMDPARDGLWRRCLGLGPAPEYCLLAAEPPAGVAASRLPRGWVAHSVTREVLWGG
ncbi:MAG: hypothetical protein QOG40_1662 [Solirubrobacteraceae bacterium]|jgi:hypothetical protein|nr:hypothetical protein [Solirubrobacteraceae bacterium]